MLHNVERLTVKEVVQMAIVLIFKEMKAWRTLLVNSLKQIYHGQRGQQGNTRKVHALKKGLLNQYQ